MLRLRLPFLRPKPRGAGQAELLRPAPAARPVVTKWSNRLLVGLFALTIGTPAIIGLGYSGPAVPRSENRNPARLPAVSDKAALIHFPERFELFFNDRLGFRRQLLDYHAYAKVNWFDSLSSPTVAVGPNNWLFVRMSTPFDQSPDRRPSAEEHARAWCAQLRDRHDWLEEHGIRFLVVIAPDKESIYPEEYPRSMRSLLEQPPLDAIVAQADQAGLNVLDLRRALREAKSLDTLYLKYDSHWNGIGGWYGARALLERLRVWRPELAIMRRDDYQLEDRAFAPDLVRHLALAKLEEPFPFFMRPAPSQAHPISIDLGAESSSLAVEVRGGFATDRSELPRVLLLHDSFGEAMIPYLQEHFDRLYCLAGYHFPRAFVERYKPDVVVELIVERMLKARPDTILRPVRPKS